MATGYLLDGADPHPLVNSLLLTPMALMPLGSAEIFSNPVALAYPGGERTVPATGVALRSLPLTQPATHFEISGFIVGNAVGGGDDVTLKLYRAPNGVDADPVTLGTKTIAISGGTASGDELLTRGDFTPEATGTVGITVASDATIDLNTTIDLSGVAEGDHIRIDGRTDGFDGGPYFEITAVDDVGDTVEVTPTPSVSDTGLAWEIIGADWNTDAVRPGGWVIQNGFADLLAAGRMGALLQQDISITADKTYFLRLVIGNATAGTLVDISIGANKIGEIVPAQIDEPNDELRKLFFGPATDTSTPLKFRSRTNGGIVGLDNVSVKAVTLYHFSYVGVVFGTEADKAFGSFLRVGLLPAADFSDDTFASVNIRRWSA